MRNAFAQELHSLAKNDPRIVLLSADIGNRLFDPMKADCPEQIFNTGVAEANTVGMATGLAMSGLLPVAYTITPFITLRCLEQIRDDVCYHNVPVTLVGTGSGLSYASLGPTHHSLDDIAVIRPFPNIRIFAPADAHEVRSVLRAIVADPGPSYIRIGKKGEPEIHQEPPEIEIGQPLTIRQGSDVCILSVGTMIAEALEAATLLEKEGVSVRVVNVLTVKPYPTDFVERLAADFPLVATVEEHGLAGGFGAATGEAILDHDLDVRLIRFGAEAKYLHTAGSQDYAREFYGLRSKDIAKGILAKLLWSQQ